jgi:hypothetical protein
LLRQPAFLVRGSGWRGGLIENRLSYMTLSHSAIGRMLPKRLMVVFGQHVRNMWRLNEFWRGHLGLEFSVVKTPHEAGAGVQLFDGGEPFSGAT